MTQEERLIQIKQLLKKKHQLSTRQIAAHFNVSFDTARRDVIHLTETGQAIRVHGGLMEINCNSVPDFLARKWLEWQRDLFIQVNVISSVHQLR